MSENEKIAAAPMRVMLVYPPSVVAERALTGANRPVISLPLGLLSIAAAVRVAGHEVRIHDARLSAKMSALGDGQSLFGDTPDEVAETIAAARPDVVGISNNFHLDVPVVKSLAAAVRRRLPGAVIVVGGHAATAIAEEYIREPAIDYVIKGEGEHKLPLLLDWVRRGLAAPAKIVDGQAQGCPFFIDDLDSLPFPAYDLVDMERYFELQRRGHSPRTREYGRRAVTLFTSRGCPWDCGFCSIHAVMGHEFRGHSAEYVLRHIGHLIERYRIDYVHFEDDNLTLDRRRFDAILDGLLAMQHRPRWDTPNGVRADMLTREQVVKARRAGCKYLVIGVESGVPRILAEKIGKKLDLEAVRRVCVWCQEIGLELQAFYVFGYPGETIADMEATRRFAMDLYRRHDAYPNVSIVLPLYGTRVHREASEKGCLVSHGGDVRIRTEEFTPEDVERVVIGIRKEIFRTFLLKSLAHPLRTLDYARVVLRNPRILRKFLPRALRR
ncbi:MAG: radical SAM protein [Phycisphaerae bacterium]|nr:radical SAM protein [Phycisphaerae bacterium]